MWSGSKISTHLKVAINVSRYAYYTEAWMPVQKNLDMQQKDPKWMNQSIFFAMYIQKWDPSVPCREIKKARNTRRVRRIRERADIEAFSSRKETSKQVIILRPCRQEPP